MSERVEREELLPCGHTWEQEELCLRDGCETDYRKKDVKEQLKETDKE